jgi:hypothetical protein
LTTFIIIVVLIYLTGLVASRALGLQETEVGTRMSRNEITEVINGYFGRIWTSVGGPGTYNYRPKLRMHAPTISIKIGTNPGGGMLVTVWTSSYTSRYGLVFHGGLMWRKRRGLAKRLIP